jgi:hypothetical protein
MIVSLSDDVEYLGWKEVVCSPTKWSLKLY